MSMITLCVCVSVSFPFFYLKAFHETLTLKAMSSQHSVLSRQRRLCVHVQKEDRQTGRGRKKLPTYSIKGTNNGGEQDGQGKGQGRNVLLL